MGLRINKNLPAIRALRTQAINNRELQKSLEKLSTGLRIVKASDDPAGLVISEQLRAQISSLQQASDNTQNAINLIGTADAALQEISDILIGIRDSLTFALNGGVTSPEQIAAEQASVDQAVNAINRIANTTRFADSGLFNGNQGYIIPAAVSNEINDLVVRSYAFAQGVFSTTVSISQINSAQRGFLSIGAGGTAATTNIVRVTGPRGTADVTFYSTTTAALFATAINTQAANTTGVFASSEAGSYWAITEEFGFNQVVTLEVIQGTAFIAGANQSAGYRSSDTGVDAQIRLGGVTYTGNGRRFNIVSPQITMQFAMDPSSSIRAISPGGAYTFRLLNTGMMFQVRERAQTSDQIFVGLDNLNASFLGFEAIQDPIARASGASATTTQGGFLTSLIAGNANDLDSNPANALRIIDSAISQVTGLRGFLGAMQSSNLEPMLNSTEVAIENLTASESNIRDLDFAEETANFTRTQILFQAGTAVLASANLIPQTVLTLLT